ncbi:MAG: LysM peptidoglycan-binding domain-containing protein [Erysipelotrichales bacterium]|nr:LysM peptidoglycan-binding domain-containing protein [Erysipelotrichales bacterium]
MKKVVINAAGGGTDIGVTGNGLTEKNTTLEISNIIKNILESKGVEVYMLRNGDETISYDDRIKDLKNKYPNSKDVIVLSNTLNSGGGTGAEIIYALNNNDNLASKINNNLNYFNDSRYYQLRYPSDTTKDYYYITRNTPGYETIIVRYGYADNASDAAIIRNNIEGIASAVANSLLDYIGILDGDYYIVKAGDTLYAIANKFGVSVDAIKKLNNLTSNSLSINQKLKIPTTETKPTPPSTSTKTNTYTVVKGDTLYAIANKYKTTVDELKKLNNLTSNTLSVGQVLKLPTSSTSEGASQTTYTVVKGDTLYAIANKFGTTVDAIKSLNSLTSNNLNIGQVLKIPGTSRTTHTVVKGDTLYSIAKKYNTTVDNIKKINNMTSNLLSIGDILYID